MRLTIEIRSDADLKAAKRMIDKLVKDLETGSTFDYSQELV